MYELSYRVRAGDGNAGSATELETPCTTKGTKVHEVNPGLSVSLRETSCPSWFKFLRY